MHIIKEKRFLGQRANKEEIRLIVLRQSLIKANSLGEKHDIGENIKALKEGLVDSGRYKRFEGEIYNAPF